MPDNSFPSSAPVHLSQEQREFYQTQGYLAPFEIFDAAQVAQTRSYVDGLLGQLGERDAYAINCYQARCAGLWDLCTNSQILDWVEQVIGPDIICWASHIFCKLPGDQKAVPWHQDAPYWQLSPCRTVTAWLAIDDTDEENAAMRFLPGSHRDGALAIQPSSGDAVLELETVNADALGQPVSNNLRAGQMSLHSDMLVHSSRPNLSERRRCGLTIRYCPAEVRPTDEGWARTVEEIVCRGDGGAWTHHERPSGDDVSEGNSPFNLGGN